MESLSGFRLADLVQLYKEYLEHWEPNILMCNCWAMPDQGGHDFPETFKRSGDSILCLNRSAQICQDKEEMAGGDAP